MNIAVVGLSHKTAPVEVREKLIIPEQKVEAAIAQLRGYPHIQEVAILSTCNRLEIYIVTSESEPAPPSRSKCIASSVVGAPQGTLYCN